MEGQNGNAPEDLELLRLKSAAYDCIHQVENWNRRLADINGEIARHQQQPPQVPADPEPAGVEG